MLNVIQFVLDHPVQSALLAGDVLATIAVGWGILWEAPEQPIERHRIATWLVIGGIAAETICSISLFAYDEMISQAQQRLIVTATDRATDADFDAAKANTAAGEAEERAAKLEKEAAQLRVKAADAELELAQIRLPRTLSPPQQEQLSNIAKQFPNTPFVLTVFNDPEAISITGQIEDCLIAGNWVEKEFKGGDIVFSRPGKNALTLNSLVGIYVQADVSKSADFGALVVLIADQLKTDGIAALSQVGAMPSNMDKSAIFIQVGKKPI
jgi:hypothetical protein